MSKTNKPPNCYICKNNYNDSLDRLHYCICDIAICDKCIHSVKKSESIWICPKCNNENDVKKSMLFRMT